MARPKKVILRESAFDSAADVHALLAEELGFPAYYGHNLDALEECLGDVCTPTRIVIRRDASDPSAWFDALEQVIRESAQRSCYLGCTIRS